MKRRCYAHTLGNCSGKSTREHFISRTVLESIADEGMITLGGFQPWNQNSSGKRISVNSFASKILCKHHNEILSNLDSLAGCFFRSLSMLHHMQPLERMFVGKDVERWMLKCLFGLMSSGNAAKNDKRVIGNEPPIHLLNTLFGERDLTGGWGLYVLQPRFQGELSIAPLISTDGKRIMGLLLGLKGIKFLLVLSPPVGSMLDGAIYRPSSITCERKNDINSSISLNWNEPHIGETVFVRYKTA